MKKSNNTYVTVSELANFKTELLTEVKSAISDALKGQMKGSTATSRGNASAPATKPELTIKDFEPVKSADGEYSWKSYNSKRTKYCYFKATKGEIKDGKVFGTKWYGKVDFSKGGAYYKAKAEFEKKYKYVKLEDRK